MSIQRRSKHQQHKKAVCKKFPELVEGTRAQTEAFWESLALPKVKQYNRKPQDKQIGKTQKQRKATKIKEYQAVCREVDERDNHTCRHPGCRSRQTQHHHAVFRSSSSQDRIENLVLLCQHHHVGSSESPHQSEYWRNYWVEWLGERYPTFWEEERTGRRITQQYNSRTVMEVAR